jgi:hypothetical protein
MAESVERSFTDGDAWFFASLCRIGNSGKLDLAKLIAIGDMLNHAIFTYEEIMQGLGKAQTWGLVRIVNRRYRLTKLAKAIHEQVKNARGGMFSIISSTQRILNSKRTKLQLVSEVKPCRFITEDAVQKGYDRYKGSVLQAK